MSRAVEPIGPGASRVEGPDEGHRAAPATPYEYPLDGVGVRVAGAVGGRRAAACARSTRPPRSALPGVLAVLGTRNAPRLGDADDAELAVLQSRRVAYRGQIVALVVADSLEAAREAAGLVRVEYDVERRTTPCSASTIPSCTRPSKVNPNFPTDTHQGDADGALAQRGDRRRRDLPHAGVPQQPDGAARHDRALGGRPAHRVRLEPGRRRGAGGARHAVRAARPRTCAWCRPTSAAGSGPRARPRPASWLAAMAARVVDRPVKLAADSPADVRVRRATARPTIQRLRLGADADGRLRCHRARRGRADVDRPRSSPSRPRWPRG